MNLFFTPEYAKTGDVIPFYNEAAGQFDNFYLKNWNPDAPKDKIIRGWHRISTVDNRNFVETPTSIRGGTGSVILVDGTYHMFYCTFDWNPNAQWARHAVSSDLEHWRDLPEDRFTADGKIYLKSDWRDPFVFWNAEEKKWWMLLAARENAPTERNGCVALCVSDDLSHWEYRKPLYASREHQAANECPDLFKMGQWYYLIYSNYTDGFCTHYRMSRSLSGPWLRPEADTFDGRAFYAAKTGSDGVHRYIYGWNPTRGENNWNFDPQQDQGNDYKTWNWGGSIIVHELHQHEDGTLGVGPVQSVAQAFCREEAAVYQPLSGPWEQSGDTLRCVSDGQFSCVLAQELPPVCRVKTKLRYGGKPAQFGIALHMDGQFSDGYYLAFDPAFRRVQYKSGLRMNEEGGKMFPYAVEMERPLVLEPGRDYEIELYIQDTIGLMYVNRDMAFSFRMYHSGKGSRLGFFTCEGTLEVAQTRIETEC